MTHIYIHLVRTFSGHMIYDYGLSGTNAQVALVLLYSLKPHKENVRVVGEIDKLLDLNAGGCSLFVDTVSVGFYKTVTTIYP